MAAAERDVTTRGPSWMELAGIVEKAPPPSLPKREPDPLPVRRRWRHDPRFVVAPDCARDAERLDVRLANGGHAV